MITVSLVEESPSTVIVLNVRLLTSASVRCSSPGAMAASVARNASMVAIRG